MPDYTFTFPTVLAGQWATAYDEFGDARATFKLHDAAVATFTLPEGTYTARVGGVDGLRTGVIQDDGVPVLNLPGAAALVLGVDSGGSVDAISSNVAITFDDIPEGYEVGTTFDFPSGLYYVYVEFDFDTPAERRYVQIRLAGTADTPCAQGPFVVEPGASGSLARTVRASFILPRGMDYPVQILLGSTVDSDVTDPADLTFGYAWASFTKIA